MMGNSPPLAYCSKWGDGPMGIERGLIVVLFVEEKPPRIGGRPVRQVHPAAGLGTGMLGQLGEEPDGLVFVARFDDIGDGDADHGGLQARFPGLSLLRF